MGQLCDSLLCVTGAVAPLDHVTDNGDHWHKFSNILIADRSNAI